MMTKSESNLWQALGQWTASIAQAGVNAELAPPDYVLKAVRDVVTQADLIRNWLDTQMTQYNVDPLADMANPNVPALAQVSKRIWYHATDDQTSWPFSEVIKSSMAE